MTEFKGKNGEGMRCSRAAVRMWELGGSSPAERKYGGGAGRADLSPFSSLLPQGNSLFQGLFFHQGISFLVKPEDTQPWGH